MNEEVRTIKAVVEIDTNKRTLRHEITANTLDGLRDRVLDLVTIYEGDL